LTGASGELGTALCELLAPRYDLALVYRTRRPFLAADDARFVDPLEPGTELAENRRPALAVRADLERSGECDRVVAETMARFGRVDLLVNNAAAALWAPMLGDRRLLDDGTRQFLVNVVVPLRLALAAARRCWAADPAANRAARRNVVNVASIAGLRCYPGGQSLYGASKAALIQLSAHMALELGEIGLRVNAVAPDSFPGIVATERVARAILALDESELTGAVVAIERDGDTVLRAAGAPGELGFVPVDPVSRTTR
jgi:NAD(P)-dependent dehydrogenase (short-subunit alcohol dehydrogenase family)